MTIMPIALVGGLMPNWVFEHFGTLLAAAGVAFAPLCGIQIVDYYVLRRRKLDVRAIYTRSPDGAYHYWNGINPAAIIAQAIGCATYIYLLNPVTYESHGPYRFVTASLPAALAAAVIYAAVTKLVVIPAGWGGYRR
jgi:NCS1 family nucleobase:cation symporter-1